MDLQTTIYIAVGLSFSLYIGIAIWARAGLASSTLPVATLTLL